MPEESKVEVSNNGQKPIEELRKLSKGAGNTGVVKLRAQTQLAQEFITPGKAFDEALARTTIRDEGQLYSICLLHQWMEAFNERHLFDTRIQALCHLLTGFNAIGGINRSIAAMVGTGIYLPDGAGVKLSKQDREALTELQRMRYAGKDKNNEGEQQG
jgi:hypothetical protein